MRWMPLSLWWRRRSMRAARWLRERLALPLVSWLLDYERRSGAQVKADFDLGRIRLSVCARCPLYRNGFCDRSQGGCGCYMPVKAHIAQATCPKGRW